MQKFLSLKNHLLVNAKQVKAMQERNHKSFDQSSADGKPWRNGPKRRIVLAEKIGALFSRARDSTRRAKNTRTYTGDEEKERPVPEEHGLELNMNHPCVHAKGDGRNCTKLSRKHRLTSSLSGIFRNSSTGLNLKKWITIQTCFASANGSVVKPSYGRISRAKTQLKRYVVRTLRKTWDEQKAQEAEEAKSELELCKKRILMGEKCRPLNPSGVLRYDDEGILLPEDFFPIEESKSLP